MDRPLPLAGSGDTPPGLIDRLIRLRWSLIIALTLVAAIGVGLLYSAAGGNMAPWASTQIQRFAVALMILLIAALAPIRFWLRASVPVYLFAVALLVANSLIGTGAGADRWIGVAGFKIQPSEIMKIALVMVLARYYHWQRHEDIGRLHLLIVPVILIAVPSAMVIKQPDLGTAVILCAIGTTIMFLSGVKLWKFGVVAAGLATVVPVAWNFLHGYQKQRILTFFDPESDPLGTGYHVIQSVIALGSGGLWGKGYLGGTQIHLNFLPEKHTDFIFPILAEEFGFMGGLVLVLLYAFIIVACLSIGARCRTQYARLTVYGITTTFFLYLFINMAMVMGMLPVVGVPLPLVSYGGTSMLSLMFGFGVILSAHADRNEWISRFADEE